LCGWQSGTHNAIRERSNEKLIGIVGIVAWKSTETANFPQIMQTSCFHAKQFIIIRGDVVCVLVSIDRSPSEMNEIIACQMFTKHLLMYLSGVLIFDG